MRFITARNRTETLLKVQLWQKLISECVHLEQVIIKIVDDGDYTNEAATIEQGLQQIRPGMSFQIKTI